MSEGQVSGLAAGGGEVKGERGEVGGAFPFWESVRQWFFFRGTVGQPPCPQAGKRGGPLFIVRR